MLTHAHINFSRTFSTTQTHSKLRYCTAWITGNNKDCKSYQW